MLRACLVVLPLLLAASALGRDAGRRRPNVTVLVPGPDATSGHAPGLRFFDGSAPERIPGTVTIDRPGYACDLDGETFRDRDEFALHVRRAHGVPARNVRDRIVVVDGIVHFVGNPP